MPGHFDIDNEEQYKAGFDLSYIRRFLKFAAPQKWLLALTLLLLIISLAANLLTPNLYRKAVDNYLLPIHNVLSIPPEILEARPDLRKASRPLDGGLYAVPASFLDKNPDLVHKINKDGEKAVGYYIFPAEKFDGSHGFVNGESWFLPDSDLGKIDKKLLASMRGRDLIGLREIFILYVVLVLVRMLAEYFHRLTLEMASQRTMYALRQNLFEHVQALSLSLYNRTPIGKLVTRVTNDVEAINSMLSTVAVQLLASFGQFLGCAVIIFFINKRLALVSFLVLPPCLVLTIVFRFLMRKIHRALRRLVAKINGFLTEEISGIRIVQVFNQQKRRRAEFSEINEDHYSAGVRMIMYVGILSPLLDLIRQAGVALILLFGGLWVLKGDVTLGTLMAFITYFGYLCAPLMQISDQITHLQSSMAAAERIFKLFDEKAEVAPPENPSEFIVPRGKVEFEHVDFSYLPGEPVLKNVSFTIDPGKSIAIVGPTGAGKSSIINLVSRFYDANCGAVRLDDVDVREWSNSDLRQHISIVLQGTFVFSRSIAENIRLGNPKISDARVRWAAETVCANRFIEKLPHGYDEIMAERGATLSAGEKQLLCFARALAHDPKILILDEATSNVDPATESLIQDAIDRLMEGRTSIIVAHRLSTIRKVDEIIYLENGEIKERGSHDELMSHMGPYYNLYILQYSRRL